MTAGPSKTAHTLGFLTVVEHSGGLFGGYLLLNLLGRPLEFHCTTPVKPNRAQEILYGPTLTPYVYGELIGQTLMVKASHKPLAVLTDKPAVLALRSQSDVPVAVVQTNVEAGAPPALATFRIGANELAVDPFYGGDRELMLERLRNISSTFDLAEPFARIREAIEESQRGSP